MAPWELAVKWLSGTCYRTAPIRNQYWFRPIIVWRRQVTSHYFSQFWSWSFSPYDGTTPEWVSILYWHGLLFIDINYHYKQRPVCITNGLFSCHYLLFIYRAIWHINNGELFPAGAVADCSVALHKRHAINVSHKWTRTKLYHIMAKHSKCCEISWNLVDHFEWLHMVSNQYIWNLL